MKILLVVFLVLLNNPIYSQSNNNLNCILQLQTKIRLIELKNLISESFYLTRSWILIDKKPDAPDKLRFLEIKDRDLKKLTDTLSILAGFQTENFQTKVSLVIKKSSILIEDEYLNLKELKTLDDYEDVIKVFNALSNIDYGSDISNRKLEILEDINLIINEIDQFLSADPSINNLNDYQNPKIRDINRLINIIRIEERLEKIKGKDLDDNVQVYKESLIKSFDNNFTHDEIKYLIEFYNSPIGQKFIKISPVLILDLMNDLKSKTK